MSSANAYGSDSPFPGLLCHLAFWFGPLFATPLFVAVNNPEDVVIPLPTLALSTAAATLALSVSGWLLARRRSQRFQWWLNRILLAIALVTALQGNVINDLFYYGAFNGERFDLRIYGWKYWAEWLGWLAAFPLAAWLLSRVRVLPAWLPALPVLSFLLLLLPELPIAAERASVAQETAVIDPSVFEFSRNRNLVHLMVDGFQGDVVRQALQEDPELAAKFAGFTLFTDHVGMYQGTAPAVYSLLTGKPFPLERGFQLDRIRSELDAASYPRRLLDAGWQVDYVPISGFICVTGANSCLPRPFNDMKARGLLRHHNEDARYSLRLIADLTLFRLAPMFLKERIYNDGRWFLADTTLDGSSPWPDPVIREWSEHLKVAGDRPVYKWHHFIGTHIPAKWDSDCRLLPQPSRTRERFLGQARCVLRDIGRLLDRLRDVGIYDQTAIIVTGDHGFNITPDDVRSPALNGRSFAGLLGAGRPTLLVKAMNNRQPLQFSRQPTWMADVAPTALHLAGLGSPEPSAFEIAPHSDRVRTFWHFSNYDFWTGHPIPFIRYGVRRPANEGSNWPVTGIENYREPPAAYQPLNRATGDGFVLGAGLRNEPGKDRSSWITGRQLAFVLGLDGPPRPRTLDLEMHLPFWVPRQRFTVEFNGGRAWRSPEFTYRPDEEWRTFSISLDPGRQQAGGNFVSIVFDELGHPPDNENWSAAALVRSIRVSEDATALGQARAHQ